MRLTRLLPDGAVDRRFGTAGTLRFAIHTPGEPHAVVTDAVDGILVGGFGSAGPAGCCGRRHIYLRRVTGEGRLDRRFDAGAARSLKRLAVPGKYPALVALVPGRGGTVSALGYTGERGGFDLRLGRDGKVLSGFGTRGVLHLPFTLEGAVEGTDGAVFAVGALDKRPYGYRAFRILANGALDPAYNRGRGVGVPISGVRTGLAALDGGRVLVTDNGNHYCRYACSSTPTMVRFLE
ncbi:MAG TPA: hypothetical protein VJL81_07515 [Solirubrobacterales bacterium]|nr:hypothetical protein [Solirubrobacterales bacterium]